MRVYICFWYVCIFNGICVLSTDDVSTTKDDDDATADGLSAL